MKYIPDGKVAEDSDSFGESYHFSSTSEEGVIKLNTTPNPASIRGPKNQGQSNATSSQLTDNLNFNYLDDSQ